VNINLHSISNGFTTLFYITGVTYFRYGYLIFDDCSICRILDKGGSFAISMTWGEINRISQFFNRGLKLGLDITFTDIWMPVTFRRVPIYENLEFLEIIFK